MAGTVVASTINNDTGLFSTNNAYLGIAKAWVNFNGTSGASPVVRGSFNISSITRTATGIYTIAFTTAMTDINYSAVGSCSYPGSTSVLSIFSVSGASQAPTTSSFSCTVIAPGVGSQDPTYMCISVLGN